MAHKVNIEIMVDTNANSRKLNGDYVEMREASEVQDAAYNQAISEFRDYLGHAHRRGVNYDVIQRDTAQLFHEKTHLMTPELAAQAGIAIKPHFLSENLEQGHYRVEPPVNGEEDYYNALATFLRRILPEKAPEEIKKLDGMTPETRGKVLQELYRAHMMPLPNKYRNGQYTKDFEAYHDVRFNAGELTAFNFLRNRSHPQEGERTAFVFVGSDREANQAMAKAREGKDDKGKLEVFVVSPAMFRRLMEQVVRDIEKEQPHMREIRQSYALLSKIDADALEMEKGGYEIHLREDEAQVPEKARAFSDFVTRLRQEPRISSIGR